MSREYEKVSQVHDIPGYPILYIRSGGVVFVTDKHTGEIYKRIDLSQYCDLWISERDTNPIVAAYYQKEYLRPKSHPDTARDIGELKELCSDKTRHRKGNDGFLLDFMCSDDCSLSETKLFRYLCTQVVVWNYSVIQPKELHNAVGFESKKYVARMFKSLEDKGLVKLINSNFDVKGKLMSLVKVHPKIYWKGRYSAWAVAIGQDYEYEESLSLSANSENGT